MTKQNKLVEIARSFSYKLNLGNYQTADFFCSQKAEVSETEAEKKSEELYEFCKNEVIKSVKKYIIDNLLKKPEKPITPQESDIRQEQGEEIRQEEIIKQEVQRSENNLILEQ